MLQAKRSLRDGNEQHQGGLGAFRFAALPEMRQERLTEEPERSIADAARVALYGLRACAPPFHPCKLRRSKTASYYSRPTRVYKKFQCEIGIVTIGDRPPCSTCFCRKRSGPSA